MTIVDPAMDRVIVFDIRVWPHAEVHIFLRCVFVVDYLYFLSF